MVSIVVNKENCVSYTTEEHIAQNYVLPDGRVGRIMTSRRFSPVKVEMKGNGVLYLNDLHLVFLDLDFSARGFKVDSVDTLKGYISSMGGHFPGIFLFDLLLKSPEIVPIFPLGCSVVFLGCRAVVRSEVQVVSLGETKIKKSFMTSLLGGLFGSIEKKQEIPIPGATAIEVEVGFFALKNSGGAIVPDFVSEEKFVQLVLDRNLNNERVEDVTKKYLIFEARL